MCLVSTVPNVLNQFPSGTFECFTSVHGATMSIEVHECLAASLVFPKSTVRREGGIG